MPVETDTNSTQAQEKQQKKKLIYRWRFWLILFILAIAIIWVSISILLAFLASKSPSGLNINTAQNIDGQSYLEKIYTTTDPHLGNPNAPLRIVEFSDFQCPYCSQAHTIIRDLLRNYPNDVFYIYRDFPLDDIHPQARTAALAAQCAYDQEKFWEYHDLLFQNQSKLDLGYLFVYAERLQLDMNVFKECLETEKYKNEVAQDQSDGFDLSVEATPTFFINGEKISGVVPYDSWVELINLTKQ